MVDAVSDRAPAQITYNPVYGVTYEGADPTRGHVYNLARDILAGQSVREVRDAIEQCALIAERYDETCDRWGKYANQAVAEEAGKDIAAAIRKLSNSADSGQSVDRDDLADLLGRYFMPQKRIRYAVHAIMELLADGPLSDSPAIPEGMVRKAVEAAYSPLPKERWSCSDDASGTALTLGRQRKWSADAVRKALSKPTPAALSARAVMPDREAVIDAISPDVLERERTGEDSRAYVERIADAILALFAKPETP